MWSDVGELDVDGEDVVSSRVAGVDACDVMVVKEVGGESVLVVARASGL
jgi:hypothetical protein